MPTLWLWRKISYRKRHSAARSSRMNDLRMLKEISMSTARIIKKYPNRRLYDTEESRYITLADIKNLVLNGADVVVIDKKSGDDITRSIFLQVITDQEQNGAAILSEEFLSQVICCYGNATPAAVADHLARSLREYVAQPQNQGDNDLASLPSNRTKNSLTSGP